MQAKIVLCLTVVIIMVLGSITGCSKTSDASPGLVQRIKALFGGVNYPAIPAIVEMNREEKVPAVDIYWDATLSMKGYAVPPGQTLYRKLPDNLESIALSLTSSSKVTFYKFGSDIVRMEGRGHRALINPDSYTETVTAINKVIDASNPSNLSILVSDLFETDADWVNISSKLSSKFFVNKLAVAVVGLKSPFEGYIYDVSMPTGQARDVFFYASGTDKHKFRPLYMIIMGPTASVETCVERLVQNSVINEREVVLFSQQITKDVPTFANAQIDENQNIQVRNRLASKKLIDANIKEFSVAHRDQQASFTARLNYVPVVGSPVIDFSKLASQIVVRKSRDNQLIEEVPNLGANINVTPGFDDGKVFAAIAFTPSKFLMKDEWYLVDITIVPKANAFQLPQWVNEWDMNLKGEVLTPENFNGATTINLQQFMNSLKNSLIEVSKPQLARIVMVLQG